MTQAILGLILMAIPIAVLLWWLNKVLTKFIKNHIFR